MIQSGFILSHFHRLERIAFSENSSEKKTQEKLLNLLGPCLFINSLLNKTLQSGENDYDCLFLFSHVCISQLLVMALEVLLAHLISLDPLNIGLLYSVAQSWGAISSLVTLCLYVIPFSLRVLNVLMLPTPKFLPVLLCQACNSFNSTSYLMGILNMRLKFYS